MSIKFENTVTPSAEQWKAAIMGARNPMNSWNKSDTIIDGDKWCLGTNDLDLMNRLRNAGTDHRKFMRMLPVTVTITAPLYWWKEADQYRIGVTTNSCSTMHKIHEKEFALEDFSCEHLISIANDDPCDALFMDGTNVRVDGDNLLGLTINVLNYYRKRYLKTKDKKYWWQMIQLLPSSYNQKRTVMLNYEVLANIYNHKLDEWRIGFMDWIKTLPYSELITGEFDDEKTGKKE